MKTDCIEWGGYRDRKGYGQKTVNYKVCYTHRLAYTQAYGDIPNGMCVLHACDNPPCMNPEHLFIGTRGDNARDMAKKGRWRSGSTKLNSDQVYWIRASKLPQSVVSDWLGVSRACVGDVRTGKTWSHL